MPRGRMFYGKTRKTAAEEVVRLLNTGPVWNTIGRDFTPEEATQQFKLWASTWITPTIAHLIPELRDERKDR